MDVFLAVKIDESESDDLAQLLDTLQRISALQSSFAATGGIDLNIEVDTKEEDYNNKLSLEEARSSLEREFGFALKDKLMVAKETLKEIADEDAIQGFKEGFHGSHSFLIKSRQFRILFLRFYSHLQTFSD